MAETAGFEQLTRRHGLKVPVGVECLVEEVVLAVGEVVGHDSIRSASRMNGAVVLFLDKVEKVNDIVETGIVLKDRFVKIFPLVNPARKVLLSNVPPFISDETLQRELSRYGQFVSAIKKIPLGCKSPLLKHVVSFRRFVYMILRTDIEEINVAFKFKVDGFDYVIFATTETMKCYGCGKEGHLVRSCPEKSNLANTAEENDPQSLNLNQVTDVEKDGQVVEMPETSANVEKGESAKKGCKKGNLRSEEMTDIEFDEVENEIFNEEENLFKVPAVKRKSNSCGEADNSKKKMQDENNTQISEVSDSENEQEVSEASVEDNVGEYYSGYSLERMKEFLQRTKGMRNVEVVGFFPDHAMFSDSARLLMKQKGDKSLSNPEVYRLKKIVQRVRAQTMQNGSQA